MKKILSAMFVLTFIVLLAGFAHAMDLQVLGVFTSASSPPVINQDALIRTDVVLRNGTSPVTATLRTDLGNGNIVNRDYLIQPNQVYNFWNTVRYTALGTYTVTSTIDPNHVLPDENFLNNNGTLQVIIQNQQTTVTLSSVTMQGNSGTSQSGTATLSNTGNVDVQNVQLSISNLVSSTNIILSTAITLNPSTVALLYSGANIPVSITVNIPSSSASGTYTGTLTATYNGQTSTSPINLVVNGGTTSGGASFTITDVEFGDSSQARDQTLTSSITLTNTGNETLAISLTSTASSNYRLQFGNSQVVIAPGSALNVPVTLYIPKSQNAGRNNIATITAQATNFPGLTRTSNIFVTTQDYLVLSKIHFDANDGTSKSLDNGGSFTVKPGVNIKMQITVRNEAIDPLDIRDITLDVRSTGSLDIDESFDVSDLSDGDKDTQDLSFDVPVDADTNNDIRITLRGRDENGANYASDYSVNIEARRKNDEITINDITLTPMSVSCDRRATLNMEVENTGDNNQNYVSVALKSNELGIDERWNGIQLDSTDTWRRVYTFNAPSSLQPGQYFIEMEAFYDTTQSSDLKSATLTVSNCQGTVIQNQTNTGNNNPPATTIPPVVFPTGTSNPSYGTTSFFNTPGYIVLLIVAVLIFIVLIITLLVKFVF